MKRILCVLLAVFGIIVLACGGGGGKVEHLSLAAGEIAFKPPPGWEEKDVPGKPIKGVIGPASAGFAPNINSVREGYSGSLDAYVNSNIKMLTNAMPSYRQVSRGAFKTENDMTGVKLAIENTQGGRTLRQTFYFFDGGAKKYVITCTCLASDADQLDAVFDKALTTFRIVK